MGAAVYTPARADAVTAQFTGHTPPAAHEVAAVFDSDIRWQRVRRATADDLLAASVGHHTGSLRQYAYPDGIFEDGVAPKPTRPTWVSVSFADYTKVNARRVTARMAVPGTPTLTSSVVAVTLMAEGFDAFASGDGATVDWLNFLVNVPGIYYNSFAHVQQSSDRISARLFDEYESPAAKRVSATFEYFNAPKVARFYAPSVQYAVTFGGSMQAFGDNAVRLAYRTIAAAGGLNALATGTVQVKNAADTLAPASWQSGTVGIGGAVSNAIQIVFAGGITSKLAWGKPTVQNLKRFLTPNGLLASQYGKPLLQGGVWELGARGFSALSVPNQVWVSRSPRYLEPGGVPWNFYTMHQVGTHRSIAPEGFEATGWGTRIVPESQTAHLQGINDLGFGGQWVSLGTRYLSPAGFKFHAAEVDRFGQQHVWNWQSYYDISTDPNDPELSGEIFGIWTLVENRNKTITHHSAAPAAPPHPTVLLGARPLLPEGITAPDPGEWEKTADVSYFIRHLSLDGIDSLVIPRWGVVSLGARPLRPAGEQQDQWGRALIWNNRRWLQKGGDFEATQWGVPFVGEGVREISFESRYGITPPAIQLPDVRLNTRYVEPVSTDHLVAGWHHLHIHWTIAYPSWAHNDTLFQGIPAVKNLTPELKQFGRDSQEFGVTHVRTQWREVVTLETYATLFGRARIADRRLWIEPGIVRGLGMTDKHKVFNLDPDPPHSQKIAIGSGQSIGYGPLRTSTTNGVTKEWYPAQPVDDHGFGELSTNATSIYPVWKDSEVGPFGSPTVELIGVTGVTLGWIDGPPAPTVTHYVRELDASPTRGTPAATYMVIGAPSLSPRTIWSVAEPPRQAIDNHPYQDLHYVGQIRSSTGGWRWDKGVGEPSIGHRYRYLRHRHATEPVFEVFGTTHIRNRHVRVEIEGIKPPIFPRPTFGGYERTVAPVNNRALKDYPPDAGEVHHEHDFGDLWGKTFVSHKVRELKPAAIGSKVALGVPLVDFFHRFVAPSGWFSQQVASHRGSQNPYQWQHIRVGPLVPNYMEGFDTSGFGKSWASHKIRDLPVEGFTATEMGPGEGGFWLRMKVWREEPPEPAARIIGGQGRDSSAFGHAALHNHRHYILPDGDMSNFRKGAPGL